MNIIHTHMDMSMCVHPYKTDIELVRRTNHRICVYTYIHTYIHTYTSCIHTCIHTYIHTYIRQKKTHTQTTRNTNTLTNLQVVLVILAHNRLHSTVPKSSKVAKLHRADSSWNLDQTQQWRRGGGRRRCFEKHLRG